MSTSPTTSPRGIRSFDELQQSLRSRGSVKAASAKAAASVPAVPEKDPAEKGTATIPKDPQTAPGVLNLPPSGTNADATPNASVPAVKKVEGEEKPASARMEKAAKVVDSIRNLRASLTTKSATAAEITVNPKLPSDKANDNKDTTPTTPTDSHPGSSNKVNPDPNAKTAEKAPAEPLDPTKKEAPTTPKMDTQVPEAGKNADATVKEAEKAAAAGAPTEAELLNLDPSYAIKLASTILATEDGRAFAQSKMEQAFGAAAAEDIINAAIFMEKQAATLVDLEQQGMLAAQAAWDEASPEEREHITKVASFHGELIEGYETDFEKRAYDQGVADAAGMAGGAMGGMPPGMDGGAGGQPGGGADPMGGAGGGAGGGESISDDDIIQVLQHLVQSGEIDQQTAEDILQQLMGGGEGGGQPGGGAGADPGAGAGGDDGGAGAPPPKGAGKKDSGEGAKEASTDPVQQLRNRAASLAEESFKQATA